MESKKNPRYTYELKCEIIQKVKDGIKRSKIQEDYGIHAETLSRWLNSADKVVGKVNGEILPVPEEDIDESVDEDDDIDHGEDKDIDHGEDEDDDTENNKEIDKENDAESDTESTIETESDNDTENNTETESHNDYEINADENKKNEVENLIRMMMIVY